MTDTPTTSAALPSAPGKAASASPSLAATPPDVQAALASLPGAPMLAGYYDAQRARAVQTAQDEWPALWRLAQAAR